MRTFAAPFEKRDLEKGFKVQKRDLKEVHWKDWKLYKKQVPRKTIYREALSLLEN